MTTIGRAMQPDEVIAEIERERRGRRAMTGEARPGNALEAAVADALGGGDPQRALSLLWTSPVLIPKAEEPAEPDSLPLPTLEDEEGRRYLPVYSSLERLGEAFPEGVGYIAIRVADLEGGWPEGVAIAVNPGSSELGFVADMPDVAIAAESSGAAGNEILVGEPADEPADALAQLSELLRDDDDVLRAHRAQFLDPRVSFDPQLAIGLEIADGADQDEVFQRVVARSQEQVEFGRPVAFIPVSSGSADPIASYMRERDQPFYTRP